MRCVRCGKREAVHEGLCEVCILELNPPLRRSILRLERCPRCGAFRIGGSWRDIGLEEAVALALKREVDKRYRILDLSLEGLDERTFRVRLRLDVYGKEAEWEGRVEVRIEPRVCDRCSRMAGGYYEAVVQLRGRHAEEAAGLVQDVVASHPSRMAFVTKVEKVRGGLDVYVGDRSAALKAARAVLEEFGGEFKESSSLYGMKEGRELRRSTYLVRTPEFSVGDVLESGGRTYIVESLGREPLVRDTWTGELKRLRDPFGAKLVARSEQLEETEVFYVEKGVAQILEPSTGRIISVPAPPWVRRGKARILRLGEEYILVPPGEGA